MKNWLKRETRYARTQVVYLSQNQTNVHVIKMSSSSLLENDIVAQFDLNEFQFFNRIIFI